LADATVVEFGVDIVEQEQRILTSLFEKYLDICKLEQQQRASLLTGRAEFADLAAVERDLEIVAVRADQRVARYKFGLDAELEPLGDERFVVRKIALFLQR